MTFVDGDDTDDTLDRVGAPGFPHGRLHGEWRAVAKLPRRRRTRACINGPMSAASSKARGMLWSVARLAAERRGIDPEDGGARPWYEFCRDTVSAWKTGVVPDGAHAGVAEDAPKFARVIASLRARAVKLLNEILKNDDNYYDMSSSDEPKFDKWLLDATGFKSERRRGQRHLRKRVALTMREFVVVFAAL